VNGSTVLLNGQSLETTFNPVQLTLAATLTATALRTLGPATIAVRNPGGSTSASSSFIVTAPAAPAASFSGPDQITPPSQAIVQFSLDKTYPAPIPATFKISVTNDASTSGTDPDVHVLINGTMVPATDTLTVMLPQSSTQPMLPLIVMAGSSAAHIQIQATLQLVDGSTITSSYTLQVQKLRPQIDPKNYTVVVRSSQSFDLMITGISTPRDMVDAAFVFEASSGHNVTSQVKPVPTSQTGCTYQNISGLFQCAFQSSTRGVFTYTQTFNVDRAVTDICAASVTLTNSAGASDRLRIVIPGAACP
jgi:hypothetical protein